MVALSFMGLTGFVSHPVSADTQKEATLRLNIMNLNCSVDQVYAGNDPLYIVTPSSCSTPSVVEIANNELLNSEQEIRAGRTNTRNVPGIFNQDEAFMLPSVPRSSGQKESIAPIVVNIPLIDKGEAEMQTMSLFVLIFLVGLSLLGFVIIIDIFVFDSRLVRACKVFVRRLFRL
jgi:hypothetical protein